MRKTLAGLVIPRGCWWSFPSRDGELIVSPRQYADLVNDKVVVLAFHELAQSWNLADVK